MSVRRKGRHEPITDEMPAWRPRRWQWIAVIVVLALGAGTALALLMSRQDSAPDAISAKSIGLVDIGNVATEGVFTVSLEDMEPGQSKMTQCVITRLTDRQPGDVARLWVVDGSGDLADDLEVQIFRAAPLAQSSWTGHPSQAQMTGCASGIVETEVTSGWTSLVGLLSQAPSYEAGFPWHNENRDSQWRFQIRIPAGIDGQEIAGETATLQLAFENRPGS